MDENPVLIQKVRRRFKSAIPLFLFHDGGGTTLPYLLLDDLFRTVWGISYPHLYDGVKFEGHMVEMAELYAGLIRSKVPRGKIMLGGWSAGGSISLQVAKCLERIPEIRVVGIIMLDTPYPGYPDWRPKDAPPVKFHIPLQPNQSEKNRKAQQQATDDVIAALAAWRLPTWDDSGASNPPPTVFIRALQAVPSDEVVEVDWFRKEPVLGWQRYNYDFIVSELTLQGNHFSIFGPDHVFELSEKMQQACTILAVIGNGA